MTEAHQAARNPLRVFLDIRRREWPLALLMFSYFFLVITTFWVLKPLKKTEFIEYYDERHFALFGWTLSAAQAELLAKVLNMVVAFGAAIAFSWLSHRFRRERLTIVFSIFFGALFVVYALLLKNPGWMTVWSFYLFGDLYSTLMVATFFAFLNDSVSPNTARRLYGLIVLGGVFGGVVGSTWMSRLIDQWAPSMWLWSCLVVSAFVVLVAVLAGRRVEPEKATRAERPEDVEETAHPAFEGARLVTRSRYLLSIVTIVGVYEIVSTIMDFQFTSTISHYLNGPAIGRQFSTVFMITNITSMFVQLFVTGFVMRRFRLGVALTIAPISVLLSSFAFLAAPFLWIGSFLNTADNAFSYSLNQSAREALYTPTTRAEKYKAKAFIDMFVQRFAKSLAVGVSLLATSLFEDFSTVRWLSLVTACLVGLWLLAARYAGRRFHHLSKEPEVTDSEQRGDEAGDHSEVRGRAVLLKRGPPARA